jgi:hypothetical protein
MNKMAFKKTMLLFSLSLIFIDATCNKRNIVSIDKAKSSNVTIDSIESPADTGSTDSNNAAIIEQPDEMTIDTVIAIVRKLPNVQKLENEVETLSKNERHINYAVLYDDSTKTIYDVRVGEDNGMSIVTYFNFRVAAKTLKILNPDGKY